MSSIREWVWRGISDRRGEQAEGRADRETAAHARGHGADLLDCLLLKGGVEPVLPESPAKRTWRLRAWLRRGLCRADAQGVADQILATGLEGE
ncbi:MAG: hypothetical protein R2748_05025 [Bryobacterales bacterium]